MCTSKEFWAAILIGRSKDVDVHYGHLLKEYFDRVHWAADLTWLVSIRVSLLYFRRTPIGMYYVDEKVNPNAFSEKEKGARENEKTKFP